MHSFASAADKVVVLPYGGTVGDATITDVLKDKTFSSRVAGRGVTGTLELSQQYAIGDKGPAGGIVFFVSSNGQHGLEAAPEDQGAGIRWYNGIDAYTEARGDGVGAGHMNTILIISKQGYDSNSYAAGLCAKLVITNAGVAYGDWYLPSKDELNLLYLQKDIVDSLTAGVYWSSTEYSNTLAWGQFFDKGVQRAFDKSTIPRVHAIRAF